MDRLSALIIGRAQKVSRVLGCGFLEKVYENALCLELGRTGLVVRQQEPLHVRYETEIVGNYVVDVLVQGKIVVELKTVDFISRAHKQQCLNYLRATGLRLCLLLNFGCRSLEVRRVVNHF